MIIVLVISFKREDEAADHFYIQLVGPSFQTHPKAERSCATKLEAVRDVTPAEFFLEFIVISIAAAVTGFGKNETNNYLLGIQSLRDALCSSGLRSLNDLGSAGRHADICVTRHLYIHKQYIVYTYIYIYMYITCIYVFIRKNSRACRQLQKLIATTAGSSTDK